MSPDERDEDKESSGNPPAGRERSSQKTPTSKTGKTKGNVKREQPAERAADASARREESDEPAASRRRAASSCTADRPTRAPAKRTSTRASKMPSESKTTPAPIPLDSQDELPPHGDELSPKSNDGRGRAVKARGAR